MKKAFIIIFIILFTYALTAKENIKDYSYVNKKIGVACKFPDNWKLFSKAKGSPEFFQSLLKNKKTANDSPLFLGLMNDQSSFARLLIEDYSDNLESYMNILMTVFEQSNITPEIFYSEDKDNIILMFETKADNISIRFLEFLTIHNGKAIRLGFWTMSSLFGNKMKNFISIAEKTLFLSTSDKQWKKAWENKFNADALVIDNKIAADPNKYEYMFYSVKGKKNTVYILGSIHVGKDDFYPLSEKIESAFKKTKNLVIEVNMESPENIKKTNDISGYGFLENDKTLEDILSKELYGMLKKKMYDYGLSIDKFKNYKPWVLSSTLNVLKLMSQGYSYDSGTEKYFMKKSAGKVIHELETFDGQTAVFNSIDNNSFLAETLYDLETDDGVLQKLIDSWKEGDEQKMNDIIFRNAANNDVYYYKLFYERNRNMADKIKDYLSENEDYFVIVGSGHLIGDRGILALLKKTGLDVK